LLGIERNLAHEREGRTTKPHRSIAVEPKSPRGTRALKVATRSVLQNEVDDRSLTPAG